MRRIGGRIDGEARVLERPQDLFPGELGAGRVGLDERERRTRGEPLPQPHPRPHAGGLGSSRHRPEQRLALRLGSQRGGTQRERGSPPQSGLQLEPGDDETGDHRNVCSIRTHVLLSSNHRKTVRRSTTLTSRPIPSTATNTPESLSPTRRETRRGSSQRGSPVAGVAAALRDHRPKSDPWSGCGSTSGSGRRASRRRGVPRRTSSSPATSRSAASA